MQVSHSLENGVCIIHFAGDLALGSLKEARTYTAPFLENPQVRVLVLDCEDVPFIGSSGIGFFALCYKQLFERNAKLLLANLNQPNVDFFKITGLNATIRVFASVEDALRSLNP